MIKQLTGKVVKGLGGLYETRVRDNGQIKRIVCRAKGVLRRDEDKVHIGDEVVIITDESTPDGTVIGEILPRRNSLIRPPIANLDYLFIVFSAKKPSPVIENVDKLIAIAYHNRITPVVVITKGDLDGEVAEEYKALYESVGTLVFVTSSSTLFGVEALKDFINDEIRDGKTAAFAGASGVGKSTLMNALFPSLTLATAEISRKIERGRHTTRHVEIFDISDECDTGFLADTPGFSLVDFERFDFFDIEDLLPAFPDILRYSDGCRYSDCSHVGESVRECAVARAEAEGKIAPSRLASYRSIYKVLNSKSKYD